MCMTLLSQQVTGQIQPVPTKIALTSQFKRELVPWMHSKYHTLIRIVFYQHLTGHVRMGILAHIATLSKGRFFFFHDYISKTSMAWTC